MRARPVIFALALAGALGSGALAACSPSPAPPAVDAGDAGDATDEASCPNDLPASCPQPAPSWATDVQPIFQRRCYACHTDGGVSSAAHDFSTYAHVFAQKSAILNQVYACTMPPLGSTPPTPTERAALLAWLVCGAPND